MKYMYVHYASSFRRTAECLALQCSRNVVCTAAQPLGEESKLYAKDLVYSPELRGFSVVLSDGRGAFITAKSARYEPQSLQGVWIKDLSKAVCSTINYRYKLLAFGKQEYVEINVFFFFVMYTL